MHQQPFRVRYWVYFSDLLNDCLEIFMDDFTPYGDAFEMALVNLERIMERCEQTNVALSTEKFHMMMTEGIMLGISSRQMESR